MLSAKRHKLGAYIYIVEEWNSNLMKCFTIGVLKLLVHRYIDILASMSSVMSPSKGLKYTVMCYKIWQPMQG